MQPTDPNDGAIQAGLPPAPLAPRKPPAKNRTVRYAITLAVLILIVGGIAWIVQYLPGRGPKPDAPKPAAKKNELLFFPRALAQFSEPVKKMTKDGEIFAPVPKEVESGNRGHYDFLFKNNSDHDLNIVGFGTTCDCNSVKAFGLGSEEWERLDKAPKAKLGEPLPYKQEPDWIDLPKSPDGSAPAALVLKPQEGGVARVIWNANKVGGLLNLHPSLLYRSPNGDRLHFQELGVPVIVKPAILFEPQRVNVGVLTAGKTIQSKLVAWSCTRPQLDFKLATTVPDPLFEFEAKPFSPAELAAKQTEQLQIPSIPSQVQCAYHITVTVHESKDNHFLDQGFFFRRTVFTLDGVPGAGGEGPEIVGRVEGDVRIGGVDDHGKVIFGPFNVKAGASKEIYLESDAKMELKALESHLNQPAWVKVALTRADRQPSKNRTSWVLEVTVPKDAVGARSFEEPDAVVLRIVGAKDRFVRIPLEGHISR